MMKMIAYDADEKTLVLEVDMVNRKAELYTPAVGQDLELYASWENLPAQVWVAVGMKRNTQREAVLLPRTHWDICEVEAT